jgi:gamma-glutamyl phosphate reductase
MAALTEGTTLTAISGQRSLAALESSPISQSVPDFGKLVHAATPESYDTEFLCPEMAVKVVPSVNRR